MKSTLHFSTILLYLSIFLTSTSFDTFKASKEVICSELTDKYVDKLTGVERHIAKEKIIIRDYNGKNTFDLVWFKTHDEYTLAFKAAKNLCLDNNIDVSFHLLQGKVVTCASAHIANCESLMTINFHESSVEESKFELISNSEVVGISFENKEKNYKLKLGRRQANQFLKTLKCLRDQK
ncbi:hypothetical protein [Portibacter marinus]|uniref:hypothetical protein n=1 Tax=Portibacter marinus TaxID=2898660 RepID=UPI001F36B12A|nr:hypothetical protein [Portibacter marinus]